MEPENQKDQDESRYDFILETKDDVAAPKKSFINKKLLLLGSAALLILLVVGGAVFSTYTSRKNIEMQANLTEIAQLQTEISRVAQIGSEKTDSEQVKARADSIKTSIDESIQGTNSMLQARGISLNDDELNAKKDESLEDQLSQAVSFNTLDKAFDKAINANLIAYQRALINAEKNANGDEKQTLEDYYNKSNGMLGLVDQKN